MASFLFEAGLEEIPARMIANAEAELSRRVVELLSREQLLESGFKVQSFSTPRRLAVVLDGVRAKQSDREEQLMGPAAKVAYKEGAPTPAAHAFAKKAGVDVNALARATTAKGEYVTATVFIQSRSCAAVLEEQLSRELAQIYWAKNMYWRAGKPERFVRPIEWMVALLNDQVVPVTFGGVTAGRLTYGHRVLHGASPIAVQRPDEYVSKLEQGFVLPDVAARRQKIRKALDAATRTLPGARWREDEILVETVTHLTEWPSVLVGSFEAEYLDLPEEVLVTVMRDHQKYFAAEDTAGRLKANFLAVLNTEVGSDGMEIIRHGNARVLRARFNDARFFWQYDQKISLEDRVALLRNVTFQKDIGSYHQKTLENEHLARTYADVAMERGVVLDRSALLLAVKLAKADLTAEMVKEFTELQGIVGGLYAQAQGHGSVVAKAIYTQYRPASAEDLIPETVEGQLLGLADRMQTISAMFAIGLQPTGSKDPFALRRAANGVVRILAEGALPLTIDDLMTGIATFGSELKAFFRERLEFYLRESKGFRFDVVNAVLATDASDVRDAVARAEALTQMRGEDDFLAVSAAFKRIKNILKQAQEKEAVDTRWIVDEKALSEPEEQQLWLQSKRSAPEVEQLQAQRAYKEALQMTAQLRPVIDAFFDKVMVMAPDERLRRNRLALIGSILDRFSRMGDFSEITA